MVGTNNFVWSDGGYKSEEGVMADQAWKSAMAMHSRAHDPSRIMEMQRLERRWAEYE
jgi:hypothetical protein